MRFTGHRTIGLQYFVTAMIFLLVGFSLMLLMRWQLAWPTAPMPAPFAALVGETNAPGGYMAPEFYNQLVGMHGTVMIFLAVVPLLTGAFGHYLVPIHIGAATMAFPRLGVLGYWIYLAAGVLMLLGFFTEGGAANSGWTSYPPLAVLATRGQSYWLAGILLLGVSAMLNAINMIVTVVQLRSRGLTFMRLPFLVWTQLVAALLLLLAFPALQAAGILQLLDRVIGTSFFMPSGLVVSGIPSQDFSGGGNPLLWQHLFWFLGHPEVYVLILPAIGIVSMILSEGTGKPLWGYRGMVAAVLFLGIMSMVVWAHHMFLSGMGTALGTFFQVTTMIISIPSVVLITSLLLSLWGGSIRFTPPMLFALAFLPMFGVGGLSGLPLGLAPSDVMLHDTWYVVGHFHFLVAPGTVFAIFAGIYYWFPTVTGRSLNVRLGQLHFWGSLVAMTGIFLPMFTLGLRGVNRRLYDAGLQYAHAQETLGVQEHMTWMAVALGIVQLPFIINVALAFGRPRETEAADAPAAALATVQIPWTYTARPDSRVSNVRMGTWLFLASEAMLVGSLFSAWVLLRTGATAWPAATDWASASLLAVLSVLVVIPGAAAHVALKMWSRVEPADRTPRVERWVRMALGAGIASAVAFVAIEWWALGGWLAAGLRPAASLAFASWCVLAGVHALHVAGGIIANAWLLTAGWDKPSSVTLPPEAASERLHAVTRYWFFIILVWAGILVVSSL